MLGGVFLRSVVAFAVGGGRWALGVCLFAGIRDLLACCRCCPCALAFSLASAIR
jgi:hypothetical protein